MHGYSTIILVDARGVVIYLLARTYGLKWYVKTRIWKTNGEPKHAARDAINQAWRTAARVVMSMPAPNMPAMPRGYNQPLVRSSGMQQTVIKWDNVTNWQETPDYIFMMFDVKIQNRWKPTRQPNRTQTPFANQKFPIDTLRHHLQQNIGQPGFDLTDKPTDKYFPQSN